MAKNKRSNPKARDVDIVGVKFLLPKGFRKKPNNSSPELKCKNLEIKHISKIKGLLKEKPKGG